MNYISAVAQASSDNQVILHDIDTPIPEGMPEPTPFRLFAMPVRVRKVSKGGIILPDDSVDAQNWMHQLYKIAAIGKGIFSGPAYKGVDFDEADFPKVGELWLAQPKAPERFGYKGLNFVVLVDSQLRGRVDPDHLDGYKFFGLEL